MPFRVDLVVALLPSAIIGIHPSPVNCGSRLMSQAVFRKKELWRMPRKRTARRLFLWSEPFASEFF